MRRLIAFHVHGLSPSVIARRVRRTPGSVRARLFALKRKETTSVPPAAEAVSADLRAP